MWQNDEDDAGTAGKTDDGNDEQRNAENAGNGRKPFWKIITQIVERPQLEIKKIQDQKIRDFFFAIGVFFKPQNLFCDPKQKIPLLSGITLCLKKNYFANLNANPTWKTLFFTASSGLSFTTSVNPATYLAVSPKFGVK